MDKTNCVLNKKQIDKNWTDIPELVAFNVTARCNLRCKYCFEGLTKNPPEPSLEEVLGILNQLDEIGVPEILLEGGEIFAARFAKKLLSSLRNYRIKPHIISNGLLITEDIARELSELKISIGISLDGPAPEYNLYRGKKAFLKAVHAISLLVKNGVTVYVNCTVTQANIDLIPQLAELCHKLNVYGLVLQQLHCSGAADANFYHENLITLSQQQHLMNLLPDLQEKYPDLYFVESEVLDLINVPNRYKKVCKTDVDYWPKRIFRCAAGRRFCVIQADLEIIPCGILSNYRCGNLRHQTFSEIWQTSPQLQALRQLCEIRVDQIPGCGQCHYNPVCDGGCRGDVYNFSNNWLAQHPTCPLKREADSTTTS